MTESTSHVEQAIAARIAAAKIRVAAAKERRDDLAQARRRGLAARHANKLRRLAEQEQRRQADEQTTPKENPMPKRTRIPAEHTALADDIRDHQYAIVQTRVERIPKLMKGLPCMEPDGCDQPAILATLAVDEITDDDTFGLHFVRKPIGEPWALLTCEEHRCEASHDLYRLLTGRMRPDGIRAFDFPGQHLDWT